MGFGVTPPTGGPSPYFQPTQPPSNDQWIISQMEQFEKELRADMGPPPQTAKLEKLLNQMEQFMQENKKAIYEIMEKNGFPVKGAFSIATEFETAMDCIKNYLQNPSGASLDLLNESITQMNFYLTHSNDNPIG